MTFASIQRYLLRLLPFILILVMAVAFLDQQEKTSELSPPVMDVSVLDVRAEEIWNFTLSDLAGNQISLSDFQGSVVFMNFFGTWCPPCGEEMPSFETLYQRNKDRNFVMLGIAGDPEGGKTVAPFVKKYGLSFPVALDPKNEVFQRYFVRNIPVTYLLDKQGKIAAMYRGEADWSSEQAQMLLNHLLQDSSQSL